MMALRGLLVRTMHLLAQGAWAEAEASAREAMTVEPGSPHAVLLTGFAIAGMGDVDRAAPIFAGLAETHPAADHPCVDLARFQPPLPRATVDRQFAACLRLTPFDVRLRLGYAGFLLDTDRPDAADAVLADAPDTVEVNHLRGMARAELQHYGDAIASFERAVAIAPGAAASWSCLGMMLKVVDRFAEALAAHDRAVALAPDNPRFRVNRAVTLLKAGEWSRAWPDHEARLALDGAPAFDRGRLLRPGDQVRGRTILVLHEDGYGDTMQWLRYLPLLAERGARVIAAVPRAMARLVAMVPGVAQVITGLSHAPRHDRVCPMACLPVLFRTTPDTIPPVPILTPDAGLLARWSGRMPWTGMRVGLVWAGQTRPSVPGFTGLDRRRSTTLAAFGPLFDVPGTVFISLQAGPPAREPRPPGMELLDPMQDVTDFADTLAIVSSLDVVVGVDTAVIHLAGLADKPAFLLDRYDSCWRWLSGRADSPWYPRLTIFRQTEPGDWAGPMTRAAASLEAMAVYRGHSPPRHEMSERAFVA